MINDSAGERPHSGSWDAWLDGYGSAHTDTLSQQVTIPAGCSRLTLSFWLHIDTAETTTSTAYDTLTVNAAGVTVATYSNLDHGSGYVQKSFTLAKAGGTSAVLTFTGVEGSQLQTSFVLDDLALTAT